MDNNVTISKYRHVSNMKDMQCYFYVNDISVTLGSRGRAPGWIWPILRVCLQVTPGEARRAGRRKAPLSRPCRRCSGFVFRQLLHLAVLVLHETAFADVNVLVLICVPGKSEQTDDQLKEHSPSLCAMPDSQWDQDSRWVRIHQNRAPQNTCELLRAFVRVSRSRGLWGLPPLNVICEVTRPDLANTNTDAPLSSNFR